MYRTPLSFENLLQKQKLGRARNLRESVEQHLRLLLGTRKGEFRYDAEYGSPLWESDFDIGVKDNELRQILEQELTDLICRYETRLSNVRVNVRVGVEESGKGSPARVKKRLDVGVIGSLNKTNEDFEHMVTIYFSPVSFEL